MAPRLGSPSPTQYRQVSTLKSGFFVQIGKIVICRPIIDGFCRNASYTRRVYKNDFFLSELILLNIYQDFCFYIYIYIDNHHS